MSDILTVNGANNGANGILSVPSSLPSDINSLLQGYLNGLSSSISAGTANWVNYNAVLGTPVNGGGESETPPNIEEITNVNDDGSTVSGSASGIVSVYSGATDLIVQVPGAVSIQGTDSTSFALFGANSDVSYSISGGAGSIYAAGGSNYIFVTNTAQEQVYSYGNDTIAFNSGTGVQEAVTAGGSANTLVKIDNNLVTVSASGDAKVSISFLTNAGGNVDFINSSSQVATVYSGSYTVAGSTSPVYATNAVTAFGGAGGGYFVGGRAGFNSLNGGTGSSTLVGGGASDTLISGGAENYLYAGNGAETLIGGGANNNFYLGLDYIGIGAVKATGDVVNASSATGSQAFVIGQAQATTLTGSTVTGATNAYVILGNFSTTGGENVTTGGSTITITDFGANSTIFLEDGSFSMGSDAPSVETVTGALGGGGTSILLSDGTTITLKGVSTSQVSVGAGGHQINFLQ